MMVGVAEGAFLGTPGGPVTMFAVSVDFGFSLSVTTRNAMEKYVDYIYNVH